MAGARKRNRRHWPDYLLARPRRGGLYYYWKHPITKKEFGLGYDFADAASQAREANAELEYRKPLKNNLTERIKGRDTKTFHAWLDVYQDILSKRKGKGGRPRSDNTKRTEKSKIKYIRGAFEAGILITNITPQDCKKAIDPLIDQDKVRLAQSIHSTLTDCFNEAIANEWLDIGKNPVLLIKKPQPVVKRARINLAQFKRILERGKKDKDPWFETALMLAILTAQRVGDIADMKYSNIKTDSESKIEYLHIIQAKEKHPIRIPLDLSLPSFPGVALRSIIEKSQKTKVKGATNICHHRVNIGVAKAADSVHEQTMSKAFTEVLRDEFSDEEQAHEWPGKNPPTFHEIRSLAKRLHLNLKTGVNTKTLLGHTSDDSADLYADPRGEWWTVDIS
ncbi:hypothetical protein B0T40_09625 [Chromobacterium haemolyticum]|uniref:tyrosine-type recombinase/integrase n=1 Tax=Chromobacterium haemolyticum TaxID=394935 RepID=UPI0009DA0F62|nr:tyrosine-type recombinase/integrase [Chromobacterium haemolyticum]OQS36645.1 hypothetical protein B0T40_09625 [Chromobacterium haemolyticum]